MPRAPATFDALDFIPFGLQAAIIDGTSLADVTTYLQDALTSERLLNLGSGRKYNISDTLLSSGTRYIRGDFPILASQISDPDKPMIANTGQTNLRIEGIRFQGDRTALKLSTVGAGGLTIGLGMNAINCRFEGTDRSAKAIMLRQADFIWIEQCQFLNYDEAIRIEAYLAEGDRGNTQINISTNISSDTNLALYARECAELNIKNFDVYGCAAGFFIDGANRRVIIEHGHVEKFGKTGYSKTVDGIDITGHAFHIGAIGRKEAVNLKQCDVVTLESPNGVVGLYQDNISRTDRSDVVCENCEFAVSNPDQPNYKAVDGRGQIQWQGNWPYTTQVSLGDPNLISKFSDIVIDEGAFNARAISANVLASKKARDLSTSSGTIVVGADPDGILIDADLLTFTGTAEKYTSIALKAGWHTLAFTGYRITGSPIASIRADDDTTVRRVANLFEYSSVPPEFEKVFRLPFYVPTDRTYRIGFRSIADASCVVGSMKVVKGFATSPEI